jgi:hypothetical protein
MLYVVFKDGIIDFLTDGSLKFKIGIVLINVNNFPVDAFYALLSLFRLLIGLLLELILGDIDQVGYIMRRLGIL